MMRVIAAAPPGTFKLYRGSDTGVEDIILTHMSNVEEINTRIQHALTMGCYIEVIALRFQIMDYWLRIFEYLAWGLLQGGHRGRPWTRQHHRERLTQLAGWQQQLHLTSLADCLGILPSVERLTQALVTEGLSSQTVSHYRNALAAFCH